MVVLSLEPVDAVPVVADVLLALVLLFESALFEADSV